MRSGYAEHGSGVAHRTEKDFPTGCDGFSRYRKAVSNGTGRGVLCEQDVKRSGNTRVARLLIQNL